MDFAIMTPATIADHARELFKKDTGYANKTMKKLDEEISPNFSSLKSSRYSQYFVTRTAGQSSRKP